MFIVDGYVGIRYLGILEYTFQYFLNDVIIPPRYYNNENFDENKLSFFSETLYMRQMEMLNRFNVSQNTKI